MIDILLVDVHSHLDDKAFDDDIDEVISRARDAGVKKIIVNGLDPDTNRKVIALAKRFDIIEPALGLYPEDAMEDADKRVLVDLDEEIKFIESAKPLAIGEVGLDHKYVKDSERQKLAFGKFIELAKRLGVPIIVHSRGAESEVIDMLEASGMNKVVMHCFGGKLNLVKRVNELGYYLSIPPNIVRSDHFQRMVEMTPLSRLLTETDAPYLGPKQGERNEPAYVLETVKKIAEIKGMTPEETAQVIFNNYQKLF